MDNTDDLTPYKPDQSVRLLTTAFSQVLSLSVSIKIFGWKLSNIFLICSQKQFVCERSEINMYSHQQNIEAVVVWVGFVLYIISDFYYQWSSSNTYVFFFSNDWNIQWPKIDC